MSDIPERYIHPSEREWDKVASEAEKAVIKVCNQILDVMQQHKMNPALGVAMALGALGGAAQVCRLISNQDSIHIMEQYALATVRGVIRDADFPIQDNGEPFERAIQ